MGKLTCMVITGLVFAGLAALLHVYIFYMESIAWTTKRVRATFGASEAQAAATKEMAYNQGFYNLFLAVVTGIGIGLHMAGLHAVGIALVFAGIGSMLAAAVVLGLSASKNRKAAATQGVFPLLGVCLLVIGILLP